MKTLVLGGTRYVGVHLVNELLARGGDVTIATRGRAPDTFGDKVKRKIIDRVNPGSMRDAFSGERYDVVIDNLAYCSNDVRYLLDTLHADRYIMTSTASVYEDLHLGIRESEMDTGAYPLKWCSREDFDYDEIKRQAECALFQAYPSQPSAAVRFPLVFGVDDYTKRLFFYVEHVVQKRAIHIDNLDARLSFINSCEAGRFLAWAADNAVCGYINACSSNTVSLREIIGYTEGKTGINAQLSDEGEDALLNGVPSYSLDTSAAVDAGYRFADVNEWVYPTIDAWLDALRNMQDEREVR